MAQTEFGLGPDGYNVRRTPDIVAALESDIQAAFPGANVSPEATFGQLIGIFAAVAAQVEEQSFSVYNSKRLTTAEGVALDNLGMLMGFARGVDETDSDYRTRLMSVSLRNATPNNATSNLCNALRAIAGVEYVDVQTGVGTYTVVVLGGDDATIAETIFNYHPTGSTMTGNTEFDVTSECGFCQRVSFSRPTAVNVCVRIEIDPLPNCDCDVSSVTPYEDAIFEDLDTSSDSCAKRIAATLYEGTFYGPLSTVGRVQITNAEFSRDGGATYAPGPLALASDEYAVYSRDCVEVTFA